MKLDLDGIQSEELKYDICIIGSGIAGSILSNEISKIDSELRLYS